MSAATDRPSTVRRTTINLDAELAQEAKAALGAKTVTDAIHQALRDVIDRHRRAGLFEHDFSSLTPAKLAELRSSAPAKPRA